MRPIRNTHSLAAAPFVAVLLLVGVLPAVVIPLHQAILMRQDAAASVILFLALAAILLRWMMNGTQRFAASPLYVPLAAFLALVALSLLACRPASLPLGIEDAQRWLQCALMFLITLNFARSGSRPLLVLAVWGFSAVAVAVKELALQSLIDIPKLFVESRIGRSMGNVNLFGGYMAAICVLSIPMTLHFIKKRQRFRAALSAAVFLLAAAGVWLSGSRGAIAGAWAGAIYVLFVCVPGSFRKKLLILVCAVILIGALCTVIPYTRSLAIGSYEGGTVGWRTYVYGAALRMVSARPLIGFGPGSFIIEYPFYRNPDVFTHYHGQAPVSIHAHNHLLEVAAENGIAASLFLTAFYTLALMPNLLVRDARQRLLDTGVAVRIAAGAACAALLAHGMFSVVLDANIAPMSHLWIGLAIACPPPARRIRLSFRGAASLAASATLLLTAAGLALSLNGARSALHILRGGTNSENGAWHTALYHYERALSIRPFDPFTLRAKAISQRRIGDYDGALATYAALSKLAPRFGFNDYEVAEIHFTMHHPEQAMVFLRTWMETNPHHPPAHAMLIHLKLDTGNLVEAARLVDAAVERWPDNPSVLAAAARAHAVTGHFEDALALFRAALERDPDNPTLKINEILALDKLARHEEGRLRLDSLLDSDIDPASAGLRNAYLSLFPDAESRFPSLLEEGIAHAKAGRFEDAAGKFKIAAILRPQDPAPLYNLGRANYMQAMTNAGTPLQRKKLRRRAAGLLEAASRLQPDNLPILEDLANILPRAGDPAGGLEVWAHIRKLNPAHPAADDHIRELRGILGLR